MWQSSESVTAAYDKTTLSLQACYKDSGKASFCTWHQRTIKGFWIQSQSQAILRVSEVMNSSHFSLRDRKIRRTKVCLKNRKAQEWKRRDVTARGIAALNSTQCAWLPRKEMQLREHLRSNRLSCGCEAWATPSKTMCTDNCYSPGVCRGLSVQCVPFPGCSEFPQFSSSSHSHLDS